MMMPGQTEVGISPTGWRQELAGRIDTLGRNCEGRFVVDADVDLEMVPAEKFFEPEFFSNSIARLVGVDRSQFTFEDPSARSSDAANVRAFVSRFFRHYAGSLSIVALAGLAEGIGLDLSVTRCTLVIWRDIPRRLVLDLSDEEVARCRERSASWVVSGPMLDSLDDLRAYVWSRLYGQHLAPLIEQISDTTNLTQALLWTNVAESAAIVSESAREYLGEDAVLPYLEDRRALFATASLPGMTNKQNPLQERLDWTPVDGSPYRSEVTTRRLCCLSYLLEDRFGRLCASCPYLPIDEKVALIHERHGASIDAPGGEATKRAIERGLLRPSAQRIAQDRNR